MGQTLRVKTDDRRALVRRARRAGLRASASVTSGGDTQLRVDGDPRRVWEFVRREVGR